MNPAANMPSAATPPTGNAANLPRPLLGVQDALAAHHRRRQLAVVQPTGNLALVNTQWIDSEQTVYGVPGIWAPLAAGESGLRVEAAASDHILVDGTVVDGTAIVRGQDAVQPGEVTFSATLRGRVIRSESGSYALRVWDGDAEGIREFGSIDAFPYNPDWVVTADFTEVEGGSTVGFEHLADNGATRELPVPGQLAFTQGGVEHRVAAFRSGDKLQLVFGDSTNGHTTYSVGRFLYAVPAADGIIVLDFNRAVLPPCAFSYNFSCPIPPQQNRLAVPIEAGEKNVLASDGSPLHG